ncbi:MAG: UvrD-helicase domain-containing protein [Alphaproteobacteria bacterium]|nr:MAG: UvrD-helicase domain-containing protein [Alphaproteobacteria bacterium]
MTLPDMPDAPLHPAAAALLEGLNPPQREAVMTTEGPVLVLAGAGTGKTKALTTRLAWLLISGKASPWQVLAVTFTNKAAREMSLRVAHLLGQPVEGWWLGTFHALATRLLRRYAERVGLAPGFSILDTDDQLRLLQQILEEENLDAKRNPARVALAAIQSWKDAALRPADISPHDGGREFGGRLPAIYARYQERLLALNACDFGDLLLHALTLLREHSDILADCRRRWRYILVDEYQDTNTVQYLWLRLLAQEHRNLCCVGDDDQSIYSWRGAQIGNILRFEKDFPGARLVRLEQNYRSTGHILAAASGLIAHNRGRLGKTLWTADAVGEPVRLWPCWDGADEAHRVGEHIAQSYHQGTPLRSMAVLVRAGFQTREFEERLVVLGIPHRVVGGARFYERQEVRDAVAYLRVIAAPQDDLAFERIINTPKRGLGPAVLARLHALRQAQGIPLTAAAAQLIAGTEIKPKPRQALTDLLDKLDRWRDEATRLPPDQLARLVMENSGLLAFWQAETGPDAKSRLENLKELQNALAAFADLSAFLEHIALVAEVLEANDAEAVSLMTIHAAKGLEFDTVFLAGWEEGLFPHRRALDEGGSSALEEERRLAYVGLTRARRQAIITLATTRRLHGNWGPAIPSRFLAELPPANLVLQAPAGLQSAWQAYLEAPHKAGEEP